MNASSRAASNSAEKWLTHMTPAKMIQATTGNARTRTTLECSTGRIQRRRVAAG